MSKKTRENFLTKNYTQMRGITLIALVITLIVLLILVGVSIATLTGDNGILNQAQRAKEETEIATDEEQRKLAMAEAATNLENTTYVDKSGKEVPIPAGFAPTRIDGESTVEDGLVIIDSEGNEFVWIPVETEEDKTNYGKANELSKTNGAENWPTYAYDVSADGSTENPALQGKTGWENKPDPEDENAMENIKESVEKNKGFYVARYEAGVPENAEFYVDKNSKDKTYAGEGEEATEEKLAEKRNETTTKEDGTGIELKPVSKKGKQAWNFISQENAVKLSKNMYKNSTSVNSYLIDSNAWNYILKYIFETKKHITLADSSKYGNYYKNATTNYEGIKGLFAKHIQNDDWTFATEYEYGNVPTKYPPRGTGNNRLELSTGSSEDFKLYNIYDMAGNMSEWTAETVSWTSTGNEKVNYAVTRDGGFMPLNAQIPIALSGGRSSTKEYYVYVGFRCVLYLR